jgi:hypothetical protein
MGDAVVKRQILIGVVFFCLAVFFTLSTCFLTGCDSGGGSNGKAPEITNVVLYRIVGDQAIETLSFQTGDRWNFNLFSHDSDIDVDTLEISFFQQDINMDYSAYSGPDSFPLPSQTDKDMIFFFIEPFLIENDTPMGNYRVDFMLEDREGNTSNTWSVYVVIT